MSMRWRDTPPLPDGTAGRGGQLPFVQQHRRYPHGHVLILQRPHQIGGNSAAKLELGPSLLISPVAIFEFLVEVSRCLVIGRRPIAVAAGQYMPPKCSARAAISSRVEGGTRIEYGHNLVQASDRSPVVVLSCQQLGLNYLRVRPVLLSMLSSQQVVRHSDLAPTVVVAPGYEECPGEEAPAVSSSGWLTPKSELELKAPIA